MKQKHLKQKFETKICKTKTFFSNFYYGFESTFETKICKTKTIFSQSSKRDWNGKKEEEKMTKLQNGNDKMWAFIKDGTK